MVTYSEYAKNLKKGLIFAGCSFTWGQGLYYYSGLPTVVEQPEFKFNPKFLKYTHIRYAELYRYPRLVANKLDSFEIVHPVNGGSNLSAVRFWKDALFFHTGMLDSNMVYNIDPKEISILVFQLTQPHRCGEDLFNCGYSLSYCDSLEPGNRHKLKQFMQSKKLDTIDDFVNYYIEKSISTVIDFLVSCENVGIKTLVLTWPRENIPFVKKNKFLNERYITLHYKNKIFYSIEDLMEENKHLIIKYDFQNLTKPKTDHHPSKECHQVIANSIIDYMERKKIYSNRLE